jgi:hypothetical protein
MPSSIPSSRQVSIERGDARPRRRRLAVAAALLLVAGTVTGGQAANAAPKPAAPTGLGPNVIVFAPDMPQADIQTKLDDIAKQQVSNDFGTARYAVLFEPGIYGSADTPLRFQVGYYEEVAGLGQSPRDVVINGSADVYNQCDATSGCIALNNFWRSLSNLTINPQGGSGCQTKTEFWAVSQAAPLRRVNITGGTSFMDYCSAGPQYASGGFMADSAISATAVNGSQQQFYTRDSSLGGWSNGLWNQVFSGTIGQPATEFPGGNQYTSLPTTTASRERPYLYTDAKGAMRVFVPSARTNSLGTTWANGATPGHSLPLSDFFVASPSDSIAKIDSALAQGKNLLLTPGVYSVDRSIAVKRADTVVLGLGFPTLTAANGAVPLTVADVPGVDLAGMLIDAGPTNSPALLQIGTTNGNKGKSHAASAADPTGVQDVFFRVGGPHVGKASASLVANSDHVILDDIWAWRADHGSGVGWTVNTAKNGVIVNGDDVTATGLFVEHFQQYNVIWNGERGKTVFFQNELPYDAPNQAAWQHGSTLGWAAYKVADSVRTHELWGGGSYIYTNVDPTLHDSHAFEVPVTAGVKLHDVLTISLNHAGTIDHVVNDTGAPVTPDFQGPSDVTSYPGD